MKCMGSEIQARPLQLISWSSGRHPASKLPHPNNNPKPATTPCDQGQIEPRCHHSRRRCGGQCPLPYPSRAVQPPLLTQLPESPRRQSGDPSIPAYTPPHPRIHLESPRTALGGSFNSGLHTSAPTHLSRIPPTAVGGSFNSGLHTSAPTHLSRIPPTAVGGSLRSNLHLHRRHFSPNPPDGSRG